MTRSRFHVAALLGCALLSLPLVASAIPVKIDFTVRGTDGPLAGVQSWGSFSYDNSIVPAGGTGLVGGSAAGHHLSLSWGGATFTETVMRSGGMEFSNGALAGAAFGTVCLTDFSCLAQPLPLGGFYFDVQSIFDGLFTYNLDGAQRYGVTSIKRVSVPEPSTTLLFALGLAGLGVVTFRYRSSRTRARASHLT